MIFYVIEAATTASGTAKAVTEKASINDARMLFHQIMASMLANESVIEGMCTVIDKNGMQMHELTANFVREA